MPYRLGLPAWAFPGWRDKYFSDSPSMLANYASVFNTVEGNTTFYSTPECSTVRKWLQALDGKNFKFCFKLPRTITHQPQSDSRVLEDFLANISLLSDYTGSFLLQFPAWVEIDHLKRMDQVFESIAQHGGACVEVRNKRLFTHPELLEPLLQHYGFGRVMLDSRALFQGDLSHPEVQAAVHEKPDVPVLNSVYNNLIFVRLILHPEKQYNEQAVEYWARKTAVWIDQGLQPTIMIHCPNNAHCPEMAADFHERVRSLSTVDIPVLPPWPVAQQALLF